MKSKNIFVLILAIVVCELAGMIGSIFTTPSIPTWYASLPKPFLNPPSWVFAPVWTLLFALMGISVYLIWSVYSKSTGDRNRGRKNIRIAFGIFAVQLILNIFWSYLFFGRQNPGAAFVELVVLWLAILATMIAFGKISRPAMWLLLPYILWVSFAGYLNFSFWQLLRSEPVVPSSWMTESDSVSGVSFRYPETLPAKYVHTVDWPPRMQVFDQRFTCSEAGQETARAGKTSIEEVGNRSYCVTKESEGAAGSVYTMYAYAFPLGDSTAILTFSTRSVQCANYDDPEKSECETERSNFDLNSLVDLMARSVEKNTNNHED